MSGRDLVARVDVKHAIGAGPVLDAALELVLALLGAGGQRKRRREMAEAARILDEAIKAATAARYSAQLRYARISARKISPISARPLRVRSIAVGKLRKTNL